MKQSRSARPLVKAARILGAAILLISAALLGYAADGYFSARNDAAALAARADRLIAQQRGPTALGPGRVDLLLMVEDPGFWRHAGTDWTTPGSGLTTLTQSVAKRVGFRAFRPGLRKIRLIGYAMGLESKLSKSQILALYLDTVWMGRGPDGPMAGLFNASEAIFGRPPSTLTQHQFLTLVAVPIAPRTLTLASPNPALAERTARIERLVAGKCHPEGLRDVWLKGCATRQ